MIALSTLRRTNSIFGVVNKSFICKAVLAKEQNAVKQAIRKMSGGHDDDRIFYITPTRFQYTKFKDDLHFYITIGLVPMALLILYVNIFIGPATLTEIPEGYEPEPYEYYNHPIKRWIVKTFYDDEQVLHEQVLHGLNEEKENKEWREVIDKAFILMVDRDDYRGINYIPSDRGRHYRRARQFADLLDEGRGFK